MRSHIKQIISNLFLTFQVVGMIFTYILEPFQHGEHLYTSESDVCRRQILTYKDGPRTERNTIFLMVVDPQHRNSKESESANQDFYVAFKLKKSL